jgi:hypothetical protein
MIGVSAVFGIPDIIGIGLAGIASGSCECPGAEC